MRDILDVHTHTVASGHAYNSMMEMIHAAQEKELEVYGITEHAPKMPGTCGEFYFHNLKVVPREHGDLELLLGVEGNSGSGRAPSGKNGCGDREPSYTLHQTWQPGVEYGMSDSGHEKSAY